jgi:hypothetical protein
VTFLAKQSCAELQARQAAENSEAKDYVTEGFESGHFLPASEILLRGQNVVDRPTGVGLRSQKKDPR